MSDEIEINSPPYPQDGLNTQGMYKLLKEFRDWILLNSGEFEASSVRDAIPALIEIPPKESYLTQPISVQWAHFTVLRRVREQWDHIVRLFEDNWGCEACQQQRAMVLHVAAVTLNNAFIPFELRELRSQKELEGIQRVFERLTDNLRTLMEPDAYGEEEAED